MKRTVHLYRYGGDAMCGRHFGDNTAHFAALTSPLWTKGKQCRGCISARAADERKNGRPTKDRVVTT